LDPYVHHQLIHWKPKANLSEGHKLLREEPLSIRIQGKPYSVVMRTPGDEIAHVAGFCLGEGIVDALDELASIGFCEDDDTNVVTVTLKASRRDKIPEILDRRGFISQTSCGLCGKVLVKDLYQIIRPLNKDSRIDIEKAFHCINELPLIQTLRKKTKASHASVLYNSDFEILAVAEDIGRHNTLDKAIGKVFLEHRLEEVALAILSSRISYELVQKAARARIPIILAYSRPTALAVDLASKMNITLACLDEDKAGLYVFCGKHRLINSNFAS
jgi:FdhD protein